MRAPGRPGEVRIWVLPTHTQVKQMPLLILIVLNLRYTLQIIFRNAEAYSDLSHSADLVLSFLKLSFSLPSGFHSLLFIEYLSSIYQVSEKPDWVLWMSQVHDFPQHSSPVMLTLFPLSKLIKAPEEVSQRCLHNFSLFSC